MYLWLILAFIFAALEAVAVSKNIQKLEYYAKPAVMVFLLLWLYAGTDLQGNTIWFEMGIFFSLVGDVLLMIPQDRMFLFGLTAFLLAHIAYIIGFREGFAMINIWLLFLLVFIAIGAIRFLQRIVGTMQRKGENNLVIPVLIYGTVISMMLYAAMSTLYHPAWKASAALFVSLGAFLFCTSDAFLAWNKFASPFKNGRVWSITLYHLGQIGLAAGVIVQFS